MLSNRKLQILSFSFPILPRPPNLPLESQRYLLFTLNHSVIIYFLSQEILNVPFLAQRGRLLCEVSAASTLVYRRLFWCLETLFACGLWRRRPLAERPGHFVECHRDEALAGESAVCEAAGCAVEHLLEPLALLLPRVFFIHGHHGLFFGRGALLKQSATTRVVDFLPAADVELNTAVILYGVPFRVTNSVAALEASLRAGHGVTLTASVACPNPGLWLDVWMFSHWWGCWRLDDGDGMCLLKEKEMEKESMLMWIRWAVATRTRLLLQAEIM